MNNSWLPFIFYVQIFFLIDTIVKLLQKKKILTKIKKDLTLLYNVEDNFFLYNKLISFMIPKIS